MQVDYLIIGQGICGTMLSWYLHREGKTVLVMDDKKENSASRVAAGLINPVTGRRYSYSWRIEEIMPFAEQSYRELETAFDTKLIYARSIIDFFPSPDTRLAFADRMSENDTYLSSFPDQNHFNQYFNFDFGCGEIRPAYSVHLPLLLDLWRKKLQDMNALREEIFYSDKLVIHKDHVAYDGIVAEKLIFCEGVSGNSNPWFTLLPFAVSKGEAVIIEAPELTNEHIFKRGSLMVPLPEPGYFWIGSNYLWEFEDEHPTEKFRNQVTMLLNKWLKKPYKIVDHKASVRPGTLERRPFVGLHPVYDVIGICNGMGTKGTSLAPFFAYEFAQHLIHGFPITPEADVKRFTRILSK